MRFQIVELARFRRDGTTEGPLKFAPGVNLLVAPPNGGKTTWLQMFNHLLGAEHSAKSFFPRGIVESYASVQAKLAIDNDSVTIERRWHESRNTGKIFFDTIGLRPADFQKRALTALGLPLLDYPRTDVLSSPVWPALSFRMLLRHLYRQQRFWSDIVDKQPEPEFFAALLVLMGLAESIFTPGHRAFYRNSAHCDELRQKVNTQQFAINFLFHTVMGTGGRDDLSPTQKVATIENRLQEISAAINTLSGGELHIDSARKLGRLDLEQDILQRSLKYAQKGAANFADLIDLEAKTRPLFEEIERTRHSIELEDAAEELSTGMQEYLEQLNKFRPGTWQHRAPVVSFRRNKVVFNVGARRWQQALGGTDSLYYLVAYHYALLRSSTKKGRQVPGFTILDLPAEFAGEDIADHENFVVLPFIELAERQGADAMQIIVAGTSFKGLEGCNLIRLGSKHLA